MSSNKTGVNKQITLFSLTCFLIKQKSVTENNKNNFQISSFFSFNFLSDQTEFQQTLTNSKNQNSTNFQKLTQCKYMSRPLNVKHAYPFPGKVLNRPKKRRFALLHILPHRNKYSLLNIVFSLPFNLFYQAPHLSTDSSSFLLFYFRICCSTEKIIIKPTFKLEKIDSVSQSVSQSPSFKSWPLLLLFSVRFVAYV